MDSTTKHDRAGLRLVVIEGVLVVTCLGFLLAQVVLPQRSAALLFGGGVVLELAGTRYLFDPLWLRPTLAPWLVTAGMVLLGAGVGTAGLLAARWTRAQPGRPLLKGLLYGLRRMVVPMLLVEVVLQFLLLAMPPDMTTVDGPFRARLAAFQPRPRRDGSPYLWTLKPGLPGAFANSRGLHERELPLAKAPGEFRILCLGDSWTAGGGVAMEGTWPRRLEAILRERLPGRSITVINAGTGGMGYLQAYLTLTEVALAYEPDLVVTGGLHTSAGRFQADYDGYGHLPEVYRTARALARLSALCAAFRSSRGPAPSTTDVGPLHYPRKMARLLSERGIPGLHFHHVEVGPGSRLLEQALKGFASDQVVTELPSAHWVENRSRYMQPASPHPSREGQQEIARLVADALAAQPWLLRLPETGQGSGRPR